MKNKIKKLVESDVVFAVSVTAMCIDAILSIIYDSVLLGVFGLVCCVTGIIALVFKKTF
jgi:hypothetical protein